MVSKGVIMNLIEKDTLKEMIRENVKTLYRKTLEHATTEEVYQAAVFAIRDVVTEKWMKTHDEYYEKDVKVVYYLSMEFLMGRFFGNALIKRHWCIAKVFGCVPKRIHPWFAKSLNFFTIVSFL